MSGILNSKERILDAILTDEGRRQMASSTFSVKYATFTDAGIAYAPSPSEGHEDPTNKIYLEVCNLPQDSITFEADDSGKLVPFRNSDITTDVNNNPHHPTSNVSANLTGGKLTTREFHHGRLIEVDNVKTKYAAGNGFRYSDYNGAIANIYVDSKVKAGEIIYSGNPYEVKIGIKDGIPLNLFASKINDCIKLLKSEGGPDVDSLVKENFVYLDVGDSLFGNILERVGDDTTLPIKLSSVAVGGQLMSTEINASDFASQIKGIFNTSFDNFKKLQTLASINKLYQDNEFVVSENNLSFDGTRMDKATYLSLQYSTPSINSEVESLFGDEKLSNLVNFQYLPPILKTKTRNVPDADTISKFASLPRKKNNPLRGITFLGNYAPWGNNTTKLNFAQIESELKKYEKQTIYLQRTSINNNVICQFFEVSDGKASKLDVIEFGSDKTVTGVDEKNNKVYFIGKTYLDERGTQCFINMFTLVFNLSDRNFE